MITMTMAKIRIPNSLRLGLKWIKSIGAEFEGGAPYRIEKILYSYDSDSKISIGSDGSVNVPCPRSSCYDWVSDYEIRYWSNDPLDLEIFADLLWLHGFRQNSTCGNHMHFRFRSSMALFYLSDMEFINYYVNMFRQVFGNKPKYMNRLENRYSRDYYSDYELLDNIMDRGSRYHIINFMSLYEPQRTLEIRIMPWARSSAEWKRMLRFNIFVIESYLDMKFNETNKVDINADVDLNFDNEPLVEEGIVR